MNDYDTYMLRIWKEHQVSKPRRLTLENTRTGSRVGFTDLEALVAFLDNQTRHMTLQGQRTEG